jgi:hypothetical protein
MTTTQLKARIAEALEEVPESALTEVWNYLNEVRGKSEEELKRIHSLRRILRQDADLLEKLAQ